jgi:hypothetical protein
MNSKHRAGSNRQLWSALEILKSVMLADDRRAPIAPEPWFGFVKLGDFSVDITARI